MRHSKRTILLLAVGMAALPASVQAANTWCSTNFPNAIFCDDFDRYCVTPPPAPEACAIGSDRGGGVYDVWTPIGRCGAGITLEDQWVSSDPFSGRAPCPAAGQLGSSMAPLSTYIRAKFGEACGQVMATDLTPLTLECVLDGPIGKMSGFNAYLEFTSGMPQPLGNFVYSPVCDTSCGGDGSKYPIMCQQNAAPANCAPISTAPLKNSIAVGAMAYLDSNPCHCGESGDHFSYNDHLAFFDGRQWWTLKSSLFPGTFQGSGNFVLHARSNLSQRVANQIRLTIKATTIKVELTYPPLNEYSWCEVPRVYLGGFSLLNMGWTISCQLVEGTWNCINPIGNCIKGAPGGGTTTFDNIAVYGGQCDAGTGACCMSDLSCVDTHSGDCQVFGGQFAGSGTSCATTPCCPALRADHDMDGDVDLDDFGWFQTCLSGANIAPSTVPCRCAKLDADNDVDDVDLAAFLRCMTGPGIPANPNCAN